MSQGPQPTRNIIVRFYNFKILTVEKLMLIRAPLSLMESQNWQQKNKQTQNLLLIMEYHGIDH